jgi:hypothetical protein
MMLPATDRSYDAFWRQSLRWLSGEAPDAVSVVAPAVVPPGSTVPIEVTTRDGAFAPLTRPSVTLSLRSAGEARDLGTATTGPGRTSATWQADEPGLYEIAADVRDGDRAVGTATRTVLVGGVDPELVDPRLNDGALARLASASGGVYLPVDGVSRIGALLHDVQAVSPRREMRDLWHNGWALVFIAAVLSCEWALRRRWGLR